MKGTLFAGKCLTEAQLQALAENAISPQEAQPLREHIQQCPLCADALEGVKLMEEPDRLAGMLMATQQQIGTQIGGAATANRFLSPQVWMAAASVCLLVTAYLFYQIQGGSENASMATAQEHGHTPAASDVADSVRPALQMASKETHTQEGNKVAPKQASPLLRREEAEPISTSTDGEEPLVAKEAVASPPPVVAQGSAVAEQASIPAKEESKIAEEADMALADEQEAEKTEGSMRSRLLAQSESKAQKAYSMAPQMTLEIYTSPYLTEPMNQQLIHAQQEFNNGKHKEAAYLYDKLLEEAPGSTETCYLAALNYLVQGDEKKAIQKITALTLTANASDFSDIDWKKINALLKKGRHLEVRALLSGYKLQQGKLLPR